VATPDNGFIRGFQGGLWAGEDAEKEQ